MVQKLPGIETRAPGNRFPVNFTVIIPTRDQGRWIEDTIKSVLDQPGTPPEVLVYDACSTDNTSKVLERYHDRIHWTRELDRSQANAINKGFRRATGEIVAWLNSDDLYLPEAFDHVRAAFTENPQLDFIYGDAIEVDSNGHILGPNLFTEDFRLERLLLSHDFICQPTFFIRSEALARAEPLREDLHWFFDYDWLSRLSLSGMHGLRLRAFLAANRFHPETKTNSGGLERWREIMRTLAANPGPPFLLRRSCWVYSLEFVIKELTRLTADSARGNPMRRILPPLHTAFLRLVNPRSRKDIQERFQRDIAPRGDTIQGLWANAQTQDTSQQTRNATKFHVRKSGFKSAHL